MFKLRQKHPAHLILALLATACGSGEPDSVFHLKTEDAAAPTISWHEAAIDTTMLEVRMFKLIGETSAAFSELPKGGFPVVIMSQTQKDASGAEQKSLIGFAVSCKGRDPLAVARSFGEVFLDTGDIESITEEDLDALYRVSEQPHLRCDALNGGNQGTPLFSQLFRVIDENKKKSHVLARFQGFSPMDKSLYEIACQDILNNFTGENDALIPIFKDNLRDIPGGDSVKALHCFDTAEPLPQDLSIPTATPRTLPFDARLFLVKDEEANTSRVLLTGGYAFRLNCQAPDNQLQAAFGLPVTGKLDVLESSDPEFQDYLDGKVDEQPVLSCESATRPDFASDAYQIVNQKELPVPLLRLKAYEDTLLQFSCASAASLFGKIPAPLQKITDQSMEYLIRSYIPGRSKARIYSIGCAASNLSELDIQTIYRDVHGRDMEANLLAQTLNECRLQGSLCQAAWLEQKFVDTLKKSKLDSAELVMTAFQSALSRTPFPEELNYFMRRFSENARMRPHHRELQEFLKTAKSLDRKLFIASLAYAFGTDYHDDLLDRWTARQFNEPSLVITADTLKAEHDAYIRKQFLDQNIKRVYEIYFATDAKDFQLAAIKKKISAGSLTGLFQDINGMLQKLTSECVAVSPKKTSQPFQFLRPRSRLKTVTGTWTALADGAKKVGPAGHTEKYTPNNWMVNSLNLGRLLIATKNSSNAWGAWVGWKSNMTFNKISEVNMIINDKKNAYGDNSGSLNACFE